MNFNLGHFSLSGWPNITGNRSTSSFLYSVILTFSLSFRLLLNRKIAVPTIHLQDTFTHKPSRIAFNKRERARVLEEILKDKYEGNIQDTEINYAEKDWTAGSNHGSNKISRATQTDHLQVQKSVSKFTQTKNAKQDATKKNQKTVGLQASLDLVPPSSSLENKKRKYDSAGYLTQNMQDTDDAMSDSDVDSDEFSTDDDSDGDYDPKNNLDDYSSDEDREPQFRKMEPFQESSRPQKEPKYMIFHNQLLLLLSICHLCSSNAVTVRSVLKGSMLVAVVQCSHCKSTWEWCSQPKIRGYAVGDILLSAAILFSGNLPSKSLRLFKSISIACQSTRSFFRHQNNHIHYVVTKLWNSQQQELLQGVTEEGLLIGGDGRCDSMGHSAKYGSYAAVDLERNKILHVELVQSNEVKSSYHMELEGITRLIELFDRFQVKVRALVTDRHRQVTAWLKKNWQGVKHYFDCWHIAKSIKKKLKLLSKKKGYELVGEWIRSLVNHYCWSVMSTEIDDKDLIEAKWKSLIRHVQNKHEGHGYRYPRCSHQILSPETIHDTAWFTPDSEPCDALEKILLDKTLIKDIANSSALGQTSHIEGYHSLINQFAPKMYHFSFLGMKTRLLLAAMHYNENAGRRQCQNKKGKPEFTIAFPKYKKGGYIVRKVRTMCTYNYVDELFNALVSRLISPEDIHEQQDMKSPPPLCSNFDIPNKEVAVEEHTSRFN